MALKPCKECGKDISKKATTCPHCGYKKKKTSMFTWLILILMVVGIWSVVSDQTTPTATTSTSSTAPTGPAQKPDKPISSFGNFAHDALAASQKDEQARVLGLAVDSSDDFSCSNAVTPFYRGRDKEGTAYWAITCGTGSQFNVAIHSNATGSTSVMHCDMLKMMDIECYAPLDR